MAANGQYLDFDLRISFDAGQYFAEVTQSPAGNTKRELLRPPFGNDSPELLILRLENAVLRGGSYRGGPISSEERILREFGSEMFRIVFKDAASIATAFTSSLAIIQHQRGDVAGLRIKLTLEPPEMAALPWEYIFDESKDAPDYLCLRTHSPLVRFLNDGKVASDLAVDGPLNILGMIANPGGDWTLLNAAKERSRIDDAMNKLSDKSQVNFRWVLGDTLESLMEALQREPWHIFHFIGHGGVSDYQNEDGSIHKQGFLVLGNGAGGGAEVFAEDVASALDLCPTLKLAVLNCCESARGTGISSPATALLKFGIPAVLAMQYPIKDDTAVNFSSMFYTSLVAGQSIEKSLTAARKLMRTTSRVEWGIPVLFTHANSDALFKVEQKAAAPAVPAPQPAPAAAAPAAVAPADTPSAPLSDYEAKRQHAREELRRLFA